MEYYYYNCSKEYIESIDYELFNDITSLLNKLPKYKTQAEINDEILVNLSSKNWSFDSVKGINSKLKEKNNRSLCLTSSTINAGWHADFAKQFGSDIVQIEVQFGKVESMFKDFCGFRIARFERRLSLGIEIVMSEPSKYFAHRKSSVSGMAYFDIAKQTLPAIGLECPIWLIGIS